MPLLSLQDLYCFVLPFILKWVVAALVASVLVDVFSKLTRLGDKSRMTVTGRLRDMLREAWQQHFQKAPSNSDMLLTFVRVNKRRKTLKLLPSFIRFALLCLLGAMYTHNEQTDQKDIECHKCACECDRSSCGTALYQW